MRNMQWSFLTHSRLSSRIDEQWAVSTAQHSFMISDRFKCHSIFLKNSQKPAILCLPLHTRQVSNSTSKKKKTLEFKKLPSKSLIFCAKCLPKQICHFFSDAKEQHSSEHIKILMASFQNLWSFIWWSLTA